MKLLHIKQTSITIHHKATLHQLQHQLNFKNHKDINQLSISHCNCSSDPTNNNYQQTFPNNIQILNFKYCTIQSSTMRLTGKYLKIVQLTYCKIKSLPIILGQCLIKLNVGHNYIEVIEDINNNNLKLLDIRDNHINWICLAVLKSNINILHQFLPQNNSQRKILTQQLIKPNNSIKLSFPSSCSSNKPNKPNQKNQLISIQSLLSLQIYSWTKQKLLQTCQQILNNDNQILFNQIYKYLDEQFLNIIFSICKNEFKYKIIKILIKIGIANLQLQEKIILLMPQYLDKKFMAMMSMECFIKSISNIKSENHLVDVLDKIQLLSTQISFISSEKDLIAFMNLNAKYQNKSQQSLLLTQFNFFKDYQFTNHSILKYLLLLDNYKLIKSLLTLPNFITNLFQTPLLNSTLNTKFKTYKTLKKQYKQHLHKTIKYNNEHNNLYYLPQYKERRSICLKSDLYDYDILIEYEEMQGSYLNKNKKALVFKFYNKDNQISIAKRIGNQLKKSYWKKDQYRRFKNKTISSIHYTE